MAARAPARTTPHGNQDVASVCEDGHPAFKFRGDTGNKYRCTMKLPGNKGECGKDVI